MKKRKPQIRQKIRLAERGAADGDLIRPGSQNGLRRGYVRDPAAYREGDRGDGSHIAYHGKKSAAVLHRGGDIQKCELVSSGAAVGARTGHRIAGIGYINEMDAFDYAAVLHIQARHDLDGVLFHHLSLLSDRRAVIFPHDPRGT